MSPLALQELRTLSILSLFSINRLKISISGKKSDGPIKVGCSNLLILLAPSDISNISTFLFRNIIILYIKPRLLMVVCAQPLNKTPKKAGQVGYMSIIKYLRWIKPGYPQSKKSDVGYIRIINYLHAVFQILIRHIRLFSPKMSFL